MNEDDRLALSYTCPYCAEPPGSWCSTRAMETRSWPAEDRVDSPPTGRSPWLHAARTRPIMAAWRNGYGAGHTGALEHAATRMEGYAHDTTASYRPRAVADWLRTLRR